MRICVTGGTGFLGRDVVERLKRNHELIVLARRPQPIEAFRDYSAGERRFGKTSAQVQRGDGDA